MDLMKPMDEFGTEQACREVLAEIRWPDGVTCPRCLGVKHAYDSNRWVWDCYSCGYQFSALSGTVLHDTKLPLRKWFVAVFLMVEARKGMSANQMKRTLGVSYKTAWYLCHRIRAAMSVDYAPLTGTVEMDETYIGGRKRYHGSGIGGRGIAKGQSTLKDKTVVILYTDGATHLKTVGDENTIHESVDHNHEEWVRGDVHTNGIESAWSLLKRSIVGSYHQLSAKHLPAYLDEMEWRFNNRDNNYLFRDTLIQLVSAGALPYQELVG